MLPPKCIQPPWRNIDVKSVIQNGSGMSGGRSCRAEYSCGTTPHAWMKLLSAAFAGLAELDEKCQDIRHDQRDRDERGAPSPFPFVANRKHGSAVAGFGLLAACDLGFERDAVVGELLHDRKEASIEEADLEEH